MTEAKIKYPLGWYRAAIGLFFFLQGTVFATWSARIPDIKQALQLGDARLGTILFFFPLGQLVSVYSLLTDIKPSTMEHGEGCCAFPYSPKSNVIITPLFLS